MRVNTICQQCGGDLTAEVTFDIGASYGGQVEHSTDVVWIPTVHAGDCHCLRSGAPADAIVEVTTELLYWRRCW